MGKQGWQARSAEWEQQPSSYHLWRGAYSPKMQAPWKQSGKGKSKGKAIPGYTTRSVNPGDEHEPAPPVAAWTGKQDGMRTKPIQGRRRRVNEASLASLINGRSDSVFVQSLLESLFEWERESRCNVWFERVPSHSNPADDPSRGIFPMQAGLRARLDARSDSVLHAVGPS